MKTHYTFREITEREELLSCFLFRYKIYSDSELKIFLKENTYKIDIDHYDVHSRHFALFNGNEIAGYMRVILPKEKLSNHEVIEIGRQFHLLDDREHFDTNMESPFQYVSDKLVTKNHWQFFNDPLNRKQRTAETSRFMLHPEHRSIRTSKFLCECAIALHVLLIVCNSHGMTCLRTEQSPFYENYGNAVTRVSVMRTSLQSEYPTQVHTKLEDMAEEFRMSGKIERTI